MSLTQIVREAPTEVFLGALGIVSLMTGVFVVAGARAWWQMRALGSVSPTPIGKAEAGYVRIEGHAEPANAEPLLTPLTKSKVCWYRIRIEDSKRPAGERDKGITWREVREEASDVPFAVRDDIGRVVIDPYGADVTPTDRSVWYGATEEPDNLDPPRFSPAQNPKGDIIQVEWSGGGAHRYRYTEERIYPGDPIFVQGEHRLMVVSEDDDWDLDDIERTADVTANAAHATGAHTDDEARDTAPIVEEWRIGKPSRRGLPYLVATTSPADMVNIYRWGIIGTGLFAAAGLAVIVQIVRMRFG
jgi:hypothetical protein